MDKYKRNLHCDVCGGKTVNSVFKAEIPSSVPTSSELTDINRIAFAYLSCY